MKNFHQVLMSSPKLLGITSLGAALLVLTVTFGLVNSDSGHSHNGQSFNNSLFILGPGHTQAEIADRFDKEENPLIETAVTAAKEGINKKTKTLFQRVADKIAKGVSDGFKGK
jgi:hypothetical protein